MSGDTEAAFVDTLRKMEALDEPEVQEAVPAEKPALREDDLSDLPEGRRKFVERMIAEAKASKDLAAQRQRERDALHNRVAPTQQKLSKLEAELKAERDAKAALPKVLPKWDKHRQVLPEDAEAIEERLGAAMTPAEQRIAELEKRLAELAPLAEHREFIEQQRRETELRVAKAPLLKEVPDYDEVVPCDAEGNYLPSPFYDWFKDQPDFIAELMAGQDPKAHAWVVARFKKDTGVASEPPRADPAKAALLAQRQTAQQAPPARGAPQKSDEDGYAAMLRKMGHDPSKF